MPKGVYVRKGGWKVVHSEHSRKFDLKHGGKYLEAFFAEEHNTDGRLDNEGSIMSGQIELYVGLFDNVPYSRFGCKAAKHSGCE